MAHEWRRHGTVELLIEAEPTTIFDRVADVTRQGDRSEECRSCVWLPGASPQTVGARFRGRNRHGLARWSRVCEVTVSDPGRRFEFRTVPERLDLSRADSTTWGYLLRAEDGGTRVRHYYEITTMPVGPLSWLYGKLLPHHRDMRPAMAHTLERLRAELDAAPAS